MRSSLWRLRGFEFRRREPKEKREHRPPAKVDELVQASQDMQDMRSCYDGLLSAAAATANSAYEFSEALHEMGVCLLEKTALHDDEDSGHVLLMLGKAQFELQKLVDSYRTHIIQTISNPSECLLRELQIVEDMKQQCDDKRERYKLMLTAPRAKGRSKNGKGLAITAQQLQIAQEQYEEEANLFVFRLKSLKLGQSRSLLTQAARHHAAQVNFFRKGLRSLELIEPHVKFVAKQHHIDYNFGELEDDDTYYDGDGDFSCDSSDARELSFDYALNEKADDALSFHKNSTKLEQVDKKTVEISPLGTLKTKDFRVQEELLHDNQIHTSFSTQSAPIFARSKFDFSEKVKEEPPPSTRKFHTYVLPTPLDVKSTTSTSTTISASSGQLESHSYFPTQLWHSSPLEPRKLADFRDNGMLSPQQTNNEPILPQKLPSYSASHAKNMRRHAFSGPITGNSPLSNSFFTSHGASGSANRPEHSNSFHASIWTRSSNTASPSTSSPRISELHELPRPPSSPAQAEPSSLVDHSAPLLARGQEIKASARNFSIASQTASPLPPPPPSPSPAVLRSFSLPRRSQVRPLRACIRDPADEVDSPPLTPLSLKVFHSESPSLRKLQA